MNNLKRNREALLRLICDHSDTVWHRRVTVHGELEEVDVIEMCVDCFHIVREKIPCQFHHQLATHVLHLGDFLGVARCDEHISIGKISP